MNPLPDVNTAAERALAKRIAEATLDVVRIFRREFDDDLFDGWQIGHSDHGKFHLIPRPSAILERISRVARIAASASLAGISIVTTT